MRYNKEFLAEFFIYFRLAAAYYTLGLIENIVSNFNQSKNYYDLAKSKITKEIYPNYYGAIKNNMGNLLMKLGNNSNNDQSKVMETIAFWSEAIVSFSEAIPLLGFDEYLLANTYLNIGGCYSNIAMKDHDSTNNFQVAIDNFNKAKEIFTLQKYPNKYAQLQYNLGTVFAVRLEKFKKIDDRKPAIDHLNESIKFLSDNSQKKNAFTNLGHSYAPLWMERLTIDDLTNSINSYMEAIEKVKPDDLDELGFLWYDIGMIYHKWLYIEFSPNKEIKMNQALDKAEDLLDKSMYAYVHNSIHELRNDIEEVKKQG